MAAAISAQRWGNGGLIIVIVEGQRAGWVVISKREGKCCRVFFSERVVGYNGNKRAEKEETTAAVAAAAAARRSMYTL